VPSGHGAFTWCTKQKGSKTRTISGPSKKFGLKKGEYIRICYFRGKSYVGEKATKKES